MPIRQIIKIDEEKCDGCGECVTACAEGALRIINGKARLISEIYCDGFGVCIGNCPQDAITIEKREAHEFDEEKVQEHLTAMKRVEQKPAQPHAAHHHAGHQCPSAQARSLRVNLTPKGQPPQNAGEASSLSNWPVQLHLISPQAPFLREADLLITADCVSYARGDFHSRFLPGKVLAIACPKLDYTEPYSQKLIEIFRHNNLQSVTVLKMEVPCCSGLSKIVRDALQKSGLLLELKEITIGIQGDIMN